MARKTPAGTAPLSPTDLVNLDRYAMHDLASPAGRALVERCRSDLQTAGACQLHRFLRPAALDTLVAEAERLAARAHAQEDVHNVYFEDVDKSLPDDHPRRLLQRTAQKAVAWDLIPADSPLRQLYEWDALTALVAAALDKTALYRAADPLGACNITVYDEGDELGWHFDRSDFSVTLMLQTAESGGDFEYVPMIRTPEEENYSAVQRLLLGAHEGVIPFRSEPGTLAFFRGRYSIHRVPPVHGRRQRLNAVLTYGEEPGKTLNAYTQQLFYGRTA